MEHMPLYSHHFCLGKPNGLFLTVIDYFPDVDIWTLKKKKKTYNNVPSSSSFVFIHSFIHLRIKYLLRT